jgi:endonuclease/exonuclease/phosphatase family metal-dependent hydrolase
LTLSASSITLPAGVPRQNLLFFSRLRALGRRLSGIQFFHPLRHLARALLYTSEPAGKIWIDKTPATPGTGNCETLTVISANLWHDWPQYRRLQQRLDDFIQIVKQENADILLLQEVARTPGLHADEFLARQLNMAYAYTRVNGHRGTIGFEEGLAVFSRYPMQKPYLRQLAGNGNPFVRRLALGAAVETPCGELHAFSTHLGILARQNSAQILELRKWVADITSQGSAIIGGDFNAHEDRPQIKQVQREWVDTYRHLKTAGDGTTHVLRGPCGKTWRKQRLDYIFLHSVNQNWRVIETRHLNNPQAPHSDHLAVVTRLVSNPGEKQITSGRFGTE